MKRHLSVLSRLLLAALLLVLGMAGSGAAAAPDSFVIGVAPHTSARVIFAMYQPLRRHLEQALHRPVEIVTATDFTEFARNAVNQAYDIAITTAHQARLLETDARYLPLLTYKADFKAVAIVAANGPIRRAADLKGRPVLGLSASSLVTMWGQHWLKENRLGALPVRYVSASDSVAQLVVSGEAAAGFTSLTNLEKLSPALQSQLRVLSTSPAMAGRVYLLNGRNSAMKKRVLAELWAFAASADGKRYFQENNLEGYRRLHPGELRSMEHYAAEVRQQLKAK